MGKKKELSGVVGVFDYPNISAFDILIKTWTGLMDRDDSDFTKILQQHIAFEPFVEKNEFGRTRRSHHGSTWL